MTATYIISGVIALIVIYIIYRTFFGKKRGGCNCGCGGCSNSSCCHSEEGHKHEDNQ